VDVVLIKFSNFTSHFSQQLLMAEIWYLVTSFIYGKQEVGIWRVQKRYPQYGILIWCLWPNIRFLPSTVTEKNATKNILDERKDGQTDRGKTLYPPHGRNLIFGHKLHIGMPYCGKRFWTRQIPTSCLPT
jgi:hypothetical protein